MKLVLRYKFEILILLILIAFYFILRLPNLTLQPIFADEAIYIRWAQVMRAEPTLRFLPVSDGKTPLFMWTLMPVLKFIEDPLLAGRFLSVLSGFFTLLGVYFLTRFVFSKRAAFLATLLYAVVPYTVFFDRMALVDAMLSAFTIWIIYFAIWLSKSLRLDIAMILGYLLGGAVLTKTSGMINLLILPVSILTYVRAKNEKYGLVKLFLLWAVAISLGFLMYNLLRLGPQFHLLSSRNQDYIFSPLELVGRPLDPFIPHLRDMFDWFPKLLTWPVLILGGIGVIGVIRGRDKLGFVILLWALIPLILEMAFLRTFTARYLLPSMPLLLIFAGYGMEKVSRGFTLIILVLLVVLQPLTFNYQLLTNPPPVSLPNEERKGYFEMWTAGYGLSEIAQYLIDQQKEGKVVVGTEGFFGTLPDGLYIYLDKADIAVVGSHATISAQIREVTKDHLTFFVGNKSSLDGVGEVKLIKEFPKAKPLDGTKEDATILYQVLP